MIKNLLLVGLGGGIGSMLRYLSSMAAIKALSLHNNAGTFFVNIAGCFIAGLLIGFFESKGVLTHEWRLLFITGFCGGFTTFSAFSAESVHMFQSGNVAQAVIYISASILAGLGAVWLGLNIAR